MATNGSRDSRSESKFRIVRGTDTTAATPTVCTNSKNLANRRKALSEDLQRFCSKLTVYSYACRAVYAFDCLSFSMICLFSSSCPCQTPI